MDHSVKVIMGGGSVNQAHSELTHEDKLREAFQILKDGGCTKFDTAHLYGESERRLGEARAIDHFVIDTKARGGFDPNGGASYENILKQAKESKEKLSGNVDVYYIHAPDAKTPIEETLRGIDEVHKSGFFKRFGLSNYDPADVQRIYDHCKSQGYVPPTVYQGNYSAVARRPEEELLPLLRKLGISFNAYSPVAGGFLTKSREQIEAGAGRFQKGTFLGDMYLAMYGKPSFYEALDEWEEVAKSEGCSRSALAYRWVRFNSPLQDGDGIIIGASSIAQLKETVEALNSGPLTENAAKRIDGIWAKIAKDAPTDNFSAMKA